MPRRSSTNGPVPPARGSRPAPDATEFGRVLRRRREELGHTQAEAAALCHVGARFLSELERGKPTAEIGKALKVARRLGLEVSLTPRDGAQRPDDSPVERR